MRSAWCVSVAATSLLVMASTVGAQEFCSDLDQVVKLAPSGFQSIRDDARRGAVTTTVTRSLPGATRCWYENAAGDYWCAWEVSFDQVQRGVEQLASAVGGCYEVQADYDASLSFAFVDLPNSVPIYINGTGGMVLLSIGGRSTAGGDSGDAAAGSPRGPDTFATTAPFTSLPGGRPMWEEAP
jgi:hypothetical protein